jgi:magnesium-transporting ATPase (P-type)
VEGWAILAAVLIVSVVTAVNDCQKESQFREDLSKKGDEDVDVVVMRPGKAKQIRVQKLVVGDVVCVEVGDEFLVMASCCSTMESR